MFGLDLLSAVVRIKADSSAFDAHLDGLAAKFDELSDRLTGRISPLNAALKVTAGAALGAAAAVGACVKVGGDLEATYTSLRRVTGLTADQTGRLADNLKNIARNAPGASLSQINKIANFAGRLGVGGDTAKGKIEGITGLTAALSKLALALDDFEPEAAATQMLRILKVFHQGEGQAMNFASSLIALDNASTATGQELLAVVQRLSGVGSTLGATIPQMLALGAAMRDAGVEVESGSTAVSNLMSRMSADTAKYAAAVGLDFKQLAATISTDPVHAVEMFLTALKKYDPVKQTQILAGLHMTGRMSGQILLQLASNMQDVSKFADVANKEWREMSALESGVALSSKNAWNQLQLLGNRLYLIGAEAGQAVLPAFKALVEVLNDFANRALSSFQAAAPAMQAWGFKVANAIRLALTVFEDGQWGNWLTVFELRTEEAFNNILEVASRLKAPLFNAFREMFENLVTLVENVFDEIQQTIESKLNFMAGGKLGKGIVAAARGDWKGLYDAMTAPAAHEIDQYEHDPNTGASRKMDRTNRLLKGIKLPSGDGFSGLFDNLNGLSDAKRKQLNNAQGSIQSALVKRDFADTKKDFAGAVAGAFKDVVGGVRAGFAGTTTRRRRTRREILRRRGTDAEVGLAGVAGRGAAAAGASPAMMRMAQLGAAFALGGNGAFVRAAGVKAGRLGEGRSRGEPADDDLRHAARTNVIGRLIPKAIAAGIIGDAGNRGANIQAFRKALFKDEAGVVNRLGLDFDQTRAMVAAEKARIKKARAGDAAADQKLVAKRKGRRGGMAIPQAPEAGKVTESTGTFHGLVEFAAMLMKPGGEKDEAEKKLLEATQGQTASTDKNTAAINTLVQTGIKANVVFANA